MTSKEKSILLKALRELMRDDGDFHMAIGSICKLVGHTYPVADILKGIEGKDVRDIACGPNQEFRISGSKR